MPSFPVLLAHTGSPNVSGYPFAAGWGTKYSDPGTLPTGTGNGIAASADRSAVAVAHSVTPFVSAYPLDGGFGTKYANPATLPTDTGFAASFRGSDTLAVAHSLSPYVTAWPWSSGFGTKYSDPATTPTGTGRGVAFAPDGADLAVCHSTAPYVTAWPWSSGFGTKYSNPATTPGTTSNTVSFAPSGDYLAVAHNNSNVACYPWSSGFGTKITDPSPGSDCNGVQWSPSGLDVAMGHDSSPYVSVYPWTGSAFGTKYSNPATLPPAYVTSVAFAHDWQTLFIAHNSSPNISAYDWSASGFGSKYSDPGTLPGGRGNGVIALQPEPDLEESLLHLWLLRRGHADDGAFGTFLDYRGGAQLTQAEATQAGETTTSGLPSVKFVSTNSLTHENGEPVTAGTWSVTAWVRAAENGGGTLDETELCLVHDDGAGLISVAVDQDDGTLWIVTETGAASWTVADGCPDLFDDAWHFVAARVNADGQAILRVDAEAVLRTGATSTGTVYATPDYRISGGGVTGSAPAISDVAVWQRWLAESELDLLYGDGTAYIWETPTHAEAVVVSLSAIAASLGTPAASTASATATEQRSAEVAIGYQVTVAGPTPAVGSAEAVWDLIKAATSVGGTAELLCTPSAIVEGEVPSTAIEADVSAIVLGAVGSTECVVSPGVAAGVGAERSASAAVTPAVSQSPGGSAGQLAIALAGESTYVGTATVTLTASVPTLGAVTSAAVSLTASTTAPVGLSAVSTTITPSVEQQAAHDAVSAIWTTSQPGGVDAVGVEVSTATEQQGSQSSVVLTWSVSAVDARSAIDLVVTVGSADTSVGTASVDVSVGTAATSIGESASLVTTLQGVTTSVESVSLEITPQPSQGSGIEGGVSAVITLANVTTTTQAVPLVISLAQPDAAEYGLTRLAGVTHSQSTVASVARSISQMTESERLLTQLVVDDVRTAKMLDITYSTTILVGVTLTSGD